MVERQQETLSALTFIGFGEAAKAPVQHVTAWVGSWHLTATGANFRARPLLRG
jgi:hypothetical protein